MLSIIMLSIIMLSVIMLNIIMQRIIMVKIGMFSIIMPSIIMLISKMPTITMPSIITMCAILPCHYPNCNGTLYKRNIPKVTSVAVSVESPKIISAFFVASKVRPEKFALMPQKKKIFRKF
jgi:hypothetical protein